MQTIMGNLTLKELEYYEVRDRRIKQKRAKEDHDNFIEGFARGEYI